ncbi:MAG: hypothetical protein ACXABY_07820, partial [Candidatus Thorarchaeota archaeon]
MGLGDWLFGKDYTPKAYDFDPGAFGTGAGGQRMQQMLEQQAAGQGPSLGRGIMQQGLQQAIKNQRAQAAGAMGMNPALAQKLSGEQAGAMTAETQRQAGQVGLQEQMAAQSALQNWLQQERAAQMQLEMAKAQQFGMLEQMKAQQAAQDQGWFGPLMGMGAGILGAGIGAG